jgi:hypothetical protein
MQLGESYSIPDRYIQELHSYDPFLRIRWAKGERLVRLERKVSVKHDVTLTGDAEVEDSTARRLYDDVCTVKDGYMLITKFLPGENQWPKILYTLFMSDLQRLGGAARIAQAVEDQEDFAKARRTWNRRDDFRHMASDLFRHMNTIKTVPEGAGHKAYGGF